MNVIPLPYRILAIVAILIGCLIGGFAFGSHVRGLADDKALASLKNAQAKAVLDATQTAKLAQTQADAVTLAQQQAALANANAATQRRDADLASAHGKLAQLQSALNAQAVKTPTIQQWLTTPLPHGVTDHACMYLANGQSSTGC